MILIAASGGESIGGEQIDLGIRRGDCGDEWQRTCGAIDVVGVVAMGRQPRVDLCAIIIGTIHGHAVWQWAERGADEF